jgi:hypothetical protein
MREESYSIMSSKYLVIDLASIIFTGMLHVLGKRDVGEGKEIQQKWYQSQRQSYPWLQFVPGI